MLASTMQHSTHNHTPTHNDHHHTHHPKDRNTLDSPGQEQPHRKNTNQVSSQDPTACTSPPPHPPHHHTGQQSTRASVGDQQQKRPTQPHPHPATNPDHRHDERGGQPGTARYVIRCGIQ